MDVLSTQLADSLDNVSVNDASGDKQDLFKLLARCNLKLGQWQSALVEEHSPVSITWA